MPRFCTSVSIPISEDSFANFKQLGKEINVLYFRNVADIIINRKDVLTDYGNSRTGALHLCQLFDPSETPTTVLFHYTFLEEKYRPITEKIEAVVQKVLNPCIGKNILDD